MMYRQNISREVTPPLLSIKIFRKLNRLPHPITPFDRYLIIKLKVVNIPKIKNVY